MSNVLNKLLIITSTSLLTFNIAYAGIAQVPLHLTATVDPNVLLNMSVELPMGGAAYNDQPGTLSGGETCTGRPSTNLGTCYVADEDQVYLGYFDPEKCYLYNNSNHASDSSTGNPTTGYFYPVQAANSDHSCSSGRFSGNFMNWATMTSIDMFILTMTGGNRVVDLTDETIIRRARKHDNNSWFPFKRVASSVNVNPNTVTPFSGDIFIYNTSFGVQFGTTETNSKDSPTNSYNLKIKVCDSTVISGDPEASREENCQPTGGNNYKPEGLIQEHSDNMRFAITSYLFNLNRERDGGVLRANMKYTGLLRPDGSGGKEANPEKEVNEDGTFVANPNPTDATASSVSKSGVINFINQFSNPGYKSKDPVSELFYETIRYFKNLGPTPEYSSSLTSGENGGFPVITNWQDPIQYSCQKNFIVAINDAFPWLDKKLPGTTFTSSTFGEPSHTLINGDFGQPSNPDSSINVTTLTNTVGNLEGITSIKVGCTATNCNMDANNTKSLVGSGLGEVFGTLTWAGRENSYYVAGLAYYANTQDIRPDLEEKQTVRTFMIDTQEYNANPPLGPENMLWLTGKYGGFIDANGDNDPNDGTPGANTEEWDADHDGEPDNYVLASRPDKMVEGLKKAFGDIEPQDLTISALSSNSTSLTSTTRLYQANFNTENWDGDLFSFSIDTDGDVNPDPVWTASEQMPRWGRRNIFTYNPDLPGNKGIKFRWGRINLTQKAQLEPRAELASSSGISDRQKILQYIRGNRDWEQVAGGKFRDRTHFDENNSAHLGDIVNSNPAFVSNEYFGYDELAGSEGTSYATFQVGLSRTPMLYIGANDGMLHGFQASNGQEKFAYIPNAVMGELKDLADPLYTHQYFVDGSPRVADAYFGSDTWKTVLVSSLGAGGKALFALDVTDPDDYVESGFDGSKVLWEISDSDSDFSEMGHVLGQPSIVRLRNGQWAAVIGNGYESTSNKAMLFLVDITTGELIKKFNTKIGSAGSPNGLSTPIAVDSDGDRIADVIYAGDLQGHLWKFDISDANDSNWKIAFGNSATPEPLFRACNEDPCDNPQAITAKPQVGDHPSGGLMVYFGTGKFFETGDNIIGGSTQIQSYYAIRDNHTNTDTTSEVEGRDELQAQTIEAEVSAVAGTFRVTSNEIVDYESQYGWYLDLLSPGAASGQGERIISGSFLLNGRIIFVTFIPNPDPCAEPGSTGVSWLMEMNAISGGPLGTSPFDTNNEGGFNDDDKLAHDSDGDGEDEKHVTSGAKLDDGTGQLPVILETAEDKLDKKYFSKKSGGFEVVDESASRKRGRQTWIQF